MPYRKVTNAPDWDSLIGQEVAIHRNLHTHWITLKTLQGKDWRVVGCTQSILVRDVRFELDIDKYRWVHTNNRRTLCAWAIGAVVGQAATDISATPVPLGYNPFYSPWFYDLSTKSRRPLWQSCSWLAVIDNEVFVSPDALRSETQQSTKPVVAIASLIH